MSINFLVQDIFGSLLAFLLFPLFFVFPGYVCAHTFDLFDFKKRLLPARLAIAVVVSMAISPILFFLLYRLGSADFALLLLGLFGVGFAVILWMERKTFFKTGGEVGNNLRWAAWIFGGWVILAILSLVDFQLGNRLYYSVVSFDLTTRVSMVDAITRTGVPPISPGYFAGEYVRLTFLYYFWYIPGSLIDQIGGEWVDARMAMIASVAWCGVGLMCTIALYLRLRNPWNGAKAWKNALMGIGALAITGLDIYPVMIFLIGTRLSFGSMWPEGDIEQWNEQITAWVSAVSWVPHHVASLIACLAGFLLIQSTRGKNTRSQMAATAIAGLAFASAAGLSVWITATFVLFWAAWMLVVFFIDKEYRTVFMMVVTGIIALVFLIPFLGDLLSGGSSLVAGDRAVYFEVRVFRPLLPFLSSAPLVVKNLVNLIFLPVNYLFELGFYLLVGWLWLRQNAKSARSTNSYYVTEMLLLSVSVFVGTFVRSGIANNGIVNNDLGWRVWMFGQFILLIWAVDIGQGFLAKNGLRTYLTSKSNFTVLKHGRLLAQLMVIGLITSITSLGFMRSWAILNDMGITGVQGGLSPDTHLGERAFAARQAYEYIRDNLPENVIVQYNPTVVIDRPSGLYGTRQMAISDHSAYGLPLKVFKAMQLGVGSVFTNKENGWAEIDQTCKRYFMDIILLNDQDPAWQNLSVLREKRKPLYNNSYYAIFACGEFASR